MKWCKFEDFEKDGESWERFTCLRCGAIREEYPPLSEGLPFCTRCNYGKPENLYHKGVGLMNIYNDDFGTLAICAIRYCQGRQTYMPKLVQGIVKSHISEISNKDLQVLINDCESQAMWGGNYGSDYDKQNWLEYRDFLIAEQNKRKENKE